MKHYDSNTDEIEFLNKIVSYDKDLFFQFTKHPTGNVSCDYLSESVIDFYELSAVEIKLNPNIILKERIYLKDQENFSVGLFLHISQACTPTSEGRVFINRPT